MLYDMRPMRQTFSSPRAPDSPSKDEAIIELRRVTYGVKGRAEPLVKDLSLAVNSCRNISLTGPQRQRQNHVTATH